MQRSRRPSSWWDLPPREPEPQAPAPVVEPPAPVVHPPSTTPTLDALQEDWGANSSSDVGEGDGEFDVGTVLSTVGDLTGQDVPLYVGPDGNGGWTARASTEAGPWSSTVATTVGEDSTETSWENELDAGFAKLHQDTSIGRTVVNDRWSDEDSNLGYDMSRILGGGDVDVVGLQDKVNLNSGFSTTDDLPISIAHEEELETGHDAYHFRRAADGATDTSREQELGAELAQVDGVADFGLSTFTEMEVGEGFAFVDDLTQQQSSSVTGRRQLGPLEGSLTIGFGSGDRDMMQTLVAKTDDDTVTISLLQADADLSSSMFGVGLGRDAEEGQGGGFEVNASVGTEVEDLGYTEVEFDIDVSTPEGQAQLQAFTQTGILPGANAIEGQDPEHQQQLDDHARLSAQLGAADPDSARYHELQAELFAVSGELNGAFMDRNTFRAEQDAVPDSAEYTRWRTQQDQTLTHSASFWAWSMSRVGRVEREWDEYAIEDGEFDLESGFYQDTEWTEGDALVVSSPNAAPDLALGASSRTDMGVMRTMWEAGMIPEGLIDPALAQAVFEDGLDDFNDGGAQITTALTDRHLQILAEQGGDVEELLAEKDVWMDGYEHGEMALHNLLELWDESTDDTEGYYSDEALVGFQERYSDDDGNFDGERFLAATNDLDSEGFLALPEIEREVLIETRAQELMNGGRNPWEVLTLVEEIPDEEQRTRMMRELFETIENTPVEFTEHGLESGDWTGGVLGGDANNAASALLLQHMTTVADGLDADQADFMMSGVRVDLVDRRAADWANDRILDPMAEGQTEEEMLAGLVDEHVSWSIEHEDWDQLSDNFQAVSMAGGPAMVEALVGQLGEEELRQALADTAADDPRRLAIYGVAFAGTEYAALVDEIRAST